MAESEHRTEGLEANQIETPRRRGFLFGFFTGLLSMVVGLAPVVTGLLVTLNPLRRKSTGANMVKVTNLASLPADGTPRKFPVVADYTDKWSGYSRDLGAVYLRRDAEGAITAFQVVCPHLGCFVNYEGSEDHFHCPCHNSSFHLSGEIKSEGSPSPRGLDSLDVEAREDGSVWVRFQNFQTGITEKKPVS